MKSRKTIAIALTLLFLAALVINGEKLFTRGVIEHTKAQIMEQKTKITPQPTVEIATLRKRIK